jgi:hypothetical protein
MFASLLAYPIQNLHRVLPPFDRHGAADEDHNNVFFIQFVNLYRAITNLETKVKMEDVENLDNISAVITALGHSAARIALKRQRPRDFNVRRRRAGTRKVEHPNRSFNPCHPSTD